MNRNSCGSLRSFAAMEQRTKKRGQDLNLRPQGYEPCELPTALPHFVRPSIRIKKAMNKPTYVEPIINCF